MGALSTGFSPDRVGFASAVRIPVRTKIRSRKLAALQRVLPWTQPHDSGAKQAPPKSVSFISGWRSGQSEVRASLLARSGMHSSSQLSSRTRPSLQRCAYCSSTLRAYSKTATRPPPQHLYRLRLERLSLGILRPKSSDPLTESSLDRLTFGAVFTNSLGFPCATISI